MVCDECEKVVDIEHEKMVAVHSPPSKRQKYQKADQRLSKLVRQFIGNDTNSLRQSMLQVLLQ